MPRRTLVSNKILEEAGILGDISVEEFPLYFIPLEKDVLSLELDDSLGDLYLVCYFKVSSSEPRLTDSSGKTLRQPSWRPKL